MEKIVPDIKVGSLLQNTITNEKLRVLKISKDGYVICQTEVSSLNVDSISKLKLLESLVDNTMIVVDEPRYVIDFDSLSPEAAADYKKRTSVIDEIDVALDHDWLLILSKGPTHRKLEHIAEKYGISFRTLKRWAIRYIQSGQQKSCLMSHSFVPIKLKQDKNDENNKIVGERLFTKKLGRPNKKNRPKTGCIRDERFYRAIDFAVDYFQNTHDRGLSRQYVRRITNTLFYNEKELYGVGSDTVVADERISTRQFNREINRRISKEDMDKILTSSREVRNNKRIQPGDTVKNVQGPMDLVEIDCWDSPVSLISTYNPNQIIGPAHVYVAIDRYGKKNIAASIAFDRDSWIGLSNLFLNLIEDKHELFKRLGLLYKGSMMPEDYLPNAVITDNGGDFICDDFERFLSENNITHHIVPAAMGSLKPNVERLNLELSRATKELFQHKGCYVDSGDSDHNKTACVPIWDFTVVVFNTLYAMNQMDTEEYPMSKEMYFWKDPDTGEPFHPSPEMIWKYGIQHFGEPIRIKNKEQYLYSLLSRGTATLNKSGFQFEHLYYDCYDDNEMRELMYSTQKKKQYIHILYDPRLINCIWYIKSDGSLKCAPLSTTKAGNTDFKNISFAEWKVVRELRADIAAKSAYINDNVQHAKIISNASIVNVAVSNSRAENPTAKGKLNATRAEKMIHQSENTIAEKLISQDPKVASILHNEPLSLPDSIAQSAETIETKTKEPYVVTPLSPMEAAKQYAARQRKKRKEDSK